MVCTATTISKPDARSRPRQRRAFTAFEALLATAILAVISITVSAALMAGRQQTQNARDTMYASFLGQSLMEEIVRLPFNDPQGTTTWGPDSGETSRSQYDNTDDYANYTDGVGTSTPVIADLLGNAYSTPYQSFTPTVSMSATSFTPANWGTTCNGILVTVTVTKNGQTLCTLEQFVTP